MTGSNNIYKRVIDITSGYLGSTANSFVDSQIYNHLQKSPETLRAEDLDKLIDWLRITLAFMIDDTGLVNKYVSDLQALAKNKPRGDSSNGNKFLKAS